jgi:hypothetical protein
MLVMMIKLFEFPILLMFEIAPLPIFSAVLVTQVVPGRKLRTKYASGIGHLRTKLDSPAALRADSQGAELDVEIKHFAVAYHESTWQNHKAGRSAASPIWMPHFQSAYDEVRQQFTGRQFS